MKKYQALLAAALVAAVALVFVAVPARADVYMKQKTHTGAITVMGQT